MLELVNVLGTFKHTSFLCIYPRSLSLSRSLSLCPIRSTEERKKILRRQRHLQKGELTHTLPLGAFSSMKTRKLTLVLFAARSARVATAQRRHQARVPLGGRGKPGGASPVRTFFQMYSLAPWWPPLMPMRRVSFQPRDERAAGDGEGVRGGAALRVGGNCIFMTPRTAYKHKYGN